MIEELGKRIRIQREKCGLKQQDIAHALNVSPQAVSKWERGENAPDIVTLGPLSRLLGVSTDWLLSVHQPDREVFEATVLVSDVDGAYKKSLTMDSKPFAAWANGVFSAITDLTLSFDGIPIKYMGDGYLCFFSGTDHQKRAAQAALMFGEVVAEVVRTGLNSGLIFLGPVGHPDYARPDIMGEAVNVAFLTLQEAQHKKNQWVWATGSVLEGLDGTFDLGPKKQVNFKGIARPVEIAAIRKKKK